MIHREPLFEKAKKMLVLSRKHNESIHIGDDIEIKVVKIRGNVVGLGIAAPRDVKVMRSELLSSPDPKSVQSQSKPQVALDGPAALTEFIKDSAARESKPNRESALQLLGS
jgi:carbon storage regulator